MNESTAQDDKEMEEKTDKILKRLSKEENAEVKLSMGIKDGQVVVNFGKSVSWVGFRPAMAEEVGKKLRKLAKKLIRNGGRL